MALFFYYSRVYYKNKNYEEIEHNNSKCRWFHYSRGSYGGSYFNKSLRGKFIPYIQANVGTIHVWQRLQIGANQIDNDTWHFGFGPEVGFVARVGYMVGITLNAKYNYALSSGETLVKSDDNSYSFFNLNLGLVYIR